MGEKILAAKPVPWLALKQRCDGMAGLVGEPRRIGKLHCKDPLPQFVLIRRKEGRMTGQHLIKYATEGPLVHSLVLWRALPHLWCPISCGATRGLQQLLNLNFCTPTKIANLHLVSGCDQHVLELEVPVYPRMAVHPLHASDHLLEVKGRLTLRQSAVGCLRYKLPHGPPFAILEQHVAICVILEEPFEPQYVWVLQLLVHPHLPFGLIHHVPNLELVLLKALQGKIFAGPAVAHQPDHSEGALPQWLITHRLMFAEELSRQGVRIA
mmetsp:Transcript_101433/g.282319  ORF Transcript_101433/g.282319 Transcript_101433/m.282319 type:complete len:267 (+) Transcript_101433:734-1534(+)